eukprot:632508-Rhodomonas_salina.1
MTRRKRDHHLAENARKKQLVYPKPYLPGMDGKGVSPMDARRRFGTCTSYCEPYGMVDIKISRQSM